MADLSRDWCGCPPGHVIYLYSFSFSIYGAIGTGVSAICMHNGSTVGVSQSNIPPLLFDTQNHFLASAYMKSISVSIWESLELLPPRVI